MSTGSIMPSPVFTGWDTNGNPLAGGKLYVYLAGTNTPATVYSDVNLTVPLSNPVILDSAGRATVFLPSGSFKFALNSSADVTQWTVDNVQAVHTNQGQLGEVFVFGGDPNSVAQATSYPSGTTFDKCHAGTSIWNVDSSTLPSGTYVLEGMLMGISGGSITLGLVNLSDGAPDTALVEIASGNMAGARVRSSTITFAAAGSSKDYAIKSKVNSGGGFGWGVRVLRTA
jgi:hypothetical protein